MLSSQTQTAGFCGSLALGCSSDSFVIWQGTEKHIGTGQTGVGRWGKGTPALVGVWLICKNRFLPGRTPLVYSAAFTHIIASPLFRHHQSKKLLEEFYLPGYTV